MSASVLGLGIVAPGACGGDALQGALAAPCLRSHRVGAMNEDDPMVRRLPRLERMALSAARQALVPSAAGDSLALVFGTGYGGLAATAEFLEGIASRGAEFGSPTAFHQSVHHSPAGQLSIALGIRGPSLTVSARELSGETALQVGLNLLAAGRAERVLVVAADELPPALEAAYRAFGVLESLEPGEGAAAVLLGTTPGALRIEECTLTAHPCPILRFAHPEQFAPLLQQRAEAFRPGVSFSLAAPNAQVAAAEASILGEAVPPAAQWVDAPHFGFHPSAGLLRLVAAAVRLRAAPGGGACVVHGLALGGGQSLTVIRHVA